MAADTEVIKAHIDSSLEQRPGHVNSLLFGPSQSQACTDQGHSQESRWSFHDWQFRLFQGLDSDNKVQAAPASAYAMANQNTMS